MGTQLDGIAANVQERKMLYDDWAYNWRTGSVYNNLYGQRVFTQQHFVAFSCCNCSFAYTNPFF